MSIRRPLALPPIRQCDQPHPSSYYITMPFRIELIPETSQDPILVWDVTDAIVRAYALHSDDTLAGHILRGLQLWVNPAEARRCASAALKLPNQTHRLSVKARAGGPEAGAADAELVRLRERAERAEKGAQRLQADHQQQSQKIAVLTGEIAKLKKDATQARNETNAVRAATQAQIAAHQAELQQLRQRHEEHQSKKNSDTNELRKLRRQLDDLEIERAELLRRLGDNQLLTADRDFR